MNKSIRRYIKTGGILKRLGIDWSSTGDDDWTYYGQLINQASMPSINMSIIHNNQQQNGDSFPVSLEVTYYYAFRNAKNPNIG